MWMLDPSWRNLAVGCKRAVQLEAALLERWSAPIQQAEQRALSRARDAHAARRAANERQWAAQRAACEQRNVVSRERFAQRRAEWQQRDATARQRFAQERAAWQSRETARRSTFDELWREWSAQHSLNRRRLGTRAAIVLPAWLAITIAGQLLGPLSPPHVAFSLLAALFAGLTLMTSARHLLTHRAHKPMYPTDDPEPVAQHEPSRSIRVTRHRLRDLNHCLRQRLTVATWCRLNSLAGGGARCMPMRAGETRATRTAMRACPCSSTR